MWLQRRPVALPRQPSEIRRGISEKRIDSRTATAAILCFGRRPQILADPGIAAAQHLGRVRVLLPSWVVLWCEVTLLFTTGETCSFAIPADGIHRGRQKSAAHFVQHLAERQHRLLSVQLA